MFKIGSFFVPLLVLLAMMIVPVYSQDEPGWKVVGIEANSVCGDLLTLRFQDLSVTEHMFGLTECLTLMKAQEFARGLEVKGIGALHGKLIFPSDAQRSAEVERIVAKLTKFRQDYWKNVPK